MNSEVKEQLKNIEVNDMVVASSYAQVFSVSLNDFELVLEFVYVNPRQPEKGQLVARVTMPYEAGKKLPEVLQKLFEEQEKKKGKGNG